MRIQILKPISIAVLLGSVLCLQPAYATEQAKQRREARDTRQDGRQDSRETKQDCRAEDQKNNAECRQDKRGSKQDARETGRDIKY